MNIYRIGERARVAVSWRAFEEVRNFIIPFLQAQFTVQSLRLLMFDVRTVRGRRHTMIALKVKLSVAVVLLFTK